MKCSDCVKEGKASKLYPPTGDFSTAMGSHPYYDEKGRYHRHDPNLHSEEWSCSNGHRWVESSIDACPVKKCEWNNQTLRWRGHYLDQPPPLVSDKVE